MTSPGALLLSLGLLACGAQPRGASAALTMAGIVKRAANDDGSSSVCDLVHVDVETGASASIAEIAECATFDSAWPSGSALDPAAGEIVFSVPGAPSIWAVDVLTGAVRTVSANLDYTDNQLIGASFVSGYLYIMTRAVVYKVDPRGVEPASTLVETDFPFEEGAPCTDSVSKIWLAQGNASRVYEIDVGQASVEPIFSGQSMPKDMAYDPVTGNLFQIANWKMFEYTTTGKATQHGSIPGAGGPLYLHPRCLSIDTQGNDITITDFNNFHATAISDLPTYSVNTPFPFGGTRMIGKDLYFLPESLQHNATASAKKPRAASALRGL
jgi:hypothetical protein